MVTFVAAVKFLLEQHAQKRFSHWAETARVRIISSSPEMFGGPFLIRWSGQIVLRFEGIANDGSTVRGYALCGGILLGPLFDDTIEIKFT